ncbi:MAG TPA: outer membrane beta-barrel protein [Phycisphaerae bacterium]|nr:outer membrane beta-barrel protein [Phycisphaerae bacterium]
MFRKDAVSMAVLGLLASCGLVSAESTAVSTPVLSLEPTVVTAQDSSAATTPLMMGLEKAGVAKPIESEGLQIYGWIEGGYEANLRNNEGSHLSGPITKPGIFTSDYGNHFVLNQVALRVERDVDLKKWDVGGMVELNFGVDDNFTTPATAKDGSHSSGWELTHIGDNTIANPQLDVPQAFVDFAIPVGNGIKVRVGRFYTLTGYESFDPRGNPFYTHSLIYGTEPTENTGVLGFYQINDQWLIVGGMSRGINQNTEDNNDGTDTIGQVVFTPNKQWTFTGNWEIGPQDNADNSHYQTLLNPIASWQMTDQLKFGGEGIYIYDGGLQGNTGYNGATRNESAYGDVYGAAGYAQYAINDYLIANLRVEWLHTYTSPSNENQYEITGGVTIKPMPKDPIGKNLMIRPEIRYDVAEDHLYPVGTGANSYKDQWSAGADVIFTF